MSKVKSSILETGDNLFKTKDLRGALLKYERALSSPSSLSPEEKTVNKINII